MESFASLGGREVWNANRLAAYLRAGYGPPGVDVNACSECVGLPTGCDPETEEAVQETYTYPADPDNPAPWYDPADPDSANFAGLLVLSVTGWETAPLTRPVIQRVGDGAILGRPKYQPRTITVDALLIGKTCCSLQAGLRWLTGTMRAICNECGGDELDYFDCCPGEAGDCDSEPVPATPEQYERARRELRQVALTDGIAVTEKLGRGCGRCASGCSYMRVEFTLTAADPFSYGAERCYAEDVLISEGEEQSCVRWVVGKDACAAEGAYCDDVLCPAGDPRFPTPPPPPDLPAPDNRACTPLSSVRRCVNIDGEDVPDWQELVPLIRIYSGEATPLRSVVVKFYNNPQNRPVEELDECDVCAAFGVSYIQPDSTFVLNGKDRTFEIECVEGEPNDASSLVTGFAGRPFEFPVLNCGANYTVCVSADAATVGPDASFGVCGVPRSAA